MAMPSSPPLLPEAEPPTSPALPSDEAGELPLRPNQLARKRTLSDYGSLSSDPLFSASSDLDVDEDAERHKRKKYFRGPWYNLRRTMAKRDRARNADSGVFLGSDMSDESITSASSSRWRMADSEGDEEVQVGPSTQTSRQQRARTPTAEEFATRTITHCLETGHEAVDLTDLGLPELSNATLKPLHQLIKHSHNDLTEPPSEDEFGPLTPSIRLFLSGNKLSSLPSELFRLTNISVLSLRNNQLREIPSSIGKLSNIQELNVAQNSIRWLPWEMFDLIHCRGIHRQINVRPNPLVSPMADLHGPSPLQRPKVTPGEFNDHLNRWGETNGAFFHKMQQWYGGEDTEWTMRHELELRLKLGRLRRTMHMQEASRAGTELKLCKEQLIYLASSAVRFFDARGSIHNEGSQKISAANEEVYHAVFDPLLHQPTESAITDTPSLFEISLRSIQSNFALGPNDLPEGIPPAVTSALQRAAHGLEHSNEKCSVCSKEFLVARAEWVEFWFNGFPSQDCLTQEAILPFLRRVCSWRCAQPNEMGSFRF